MRALGRRRAMLTPQGAILVLLLGGLLFSSVYPLRRYVAVRSSIAALRTEERALDARIAELRGERDLLLSDEEVERLAREQLGMVRPGEVPFVISDVTVAPKPPLDAQGRDERGEPSASSFLSTWWDALKRAARAFR